MTLLACGINHTTTPIHVREKIAFSPDRAKSALRELVIEGAVNEAVILSTCNRVEIYSHTTSPALVQNWVADKLNTSLEPWYFHTDQEAVSHIMRVASGLDSMVLGEPQILGQMKEAYSLAKETGSIGAKLQKLFERVFNVSKQVRTDTNIGANPMTLGYCVVTLAKQIFSELSKKNILLIGGGDIIELTALHLFNHGMKRFIIANRTQSKSEILAEKVYGHIIPFMDIPIYLKEADIVISATASQLPILGKGAVESAIKARKHAPILMIDLAVPRDIEPEVSNLEDIYLYNIDDLKTLIDESRQYRMAAAQEAESIIDLQARHFIKDLQALDANNLIKQFRENLECLASGELSRAKARIVNGADPSQVMDQLVYTIINKFSHGPSTQLRKAAFDGRLDMLAIARLLLDL